MTMYELVTTQLTDIFRIGLLVGLWVTMNRTSAATGKLLPLVLGVVFVAVILPTTMPGGSPHLQDAILAGLFSNVLILAVVWLVAAVIKRLRG
jgi:hypothetical protein